MRIMLSSPDVWPNAGRASPEPDIGPVLRQLLMRAKDLFGGLDPSLKTRPYCTRNSVPHAARFGPPVRQTLGVLSFRASHAAGAHCHRFATLQSSVWYRGATQDIRV